MSTDLQSELQKEGIRWFVADLTSFEIVDPIAFESGLAVALDRLERCWAGGVPAVLVKVAPDTPTGSFVIVAAANVDKASVEQDRGLMEAIGRAVCFPVTGDAH